MIPKTGEHSGASTWSAAMPLVFRDRFSAMRASTIGQVDASATLEEERWSDRQDDWNLSRQVSINASTTSPGPATARTGSASASWCSAGGKPTPQTWGSGHARGSKQGAPAEPNRPISSLPAFPSLAALQQWQPNLHTSSTCQDVG